MPSNHIKGEQFFLLTGGILSLDVRATTLFDDEAAFIGGSKVINLYYRISMKSYRKPTDLSTLMAEVVMFFTVLVGVVNKVDDF